MGNFSYKNLDHTQVITRCVTLYFSETARPNTCQVFNCFLFRRTREKTCRFQPKPILCCKFFIFIFAKYDCRIHLVGGRVSSGHDLKISEFIKKRDNTADALGKDTEHGNTGASTLSVVFGGTGIQLVFSNDFQKGENAARARLFDGVASEPFHPARGRRGH